MWSAVTELARASGESPKSMTPSLPWLLKHTSSYCIVVSESLPVHGTVYNFLSLTTRYHFDFVISTFCIVFGTPHASLDPLESQKVRQVDINLASNIIHPPSTNVMTTQGVSGSRKFNLLQNNNFKSCNNITLAHLIITWHTKIAQGWQW